MNPRILYVEDEPINRRLVNKMLKAMGFDYLEAENGKNGINMAQRERPDLILMDINLPDMNGLDVTRVMKETPGLNDIPVVALTADPNTYRDCLEAGCDAYLNKPVSLPLMLRTITQFLPQTA